MSTTHGRMQVDSREGASVSLARSGDVLLDVTPLAPLEEDFDDGATGTFASSLINLLNTIMGSGMLAMSRAISTVGFLPGTLLICLFGFASAFGLHLLSRCAVLCGRASSFNLLSKLTYPRAALIFDLAIAIKCFGVAVSYLVLIGELMPAAMDDLYDVAETHLLRSRRFWISAFMAVIVPTSFLRRLDVLKYTSFLALTAILYIFVLAVYYFFEDVDPATGMLRRAEDTRLARVPDMEFVEYLSVFVFAFTCHQNIFSVYNEMRRNTMQRMNGVIGSSIGTATAIYIVVGSAGYAMYGGTAKSNVIMNFPQNTLSIIGRLAFTLVVVFSYALQCHPARASLDKVMTGVKVMLREWRQGGGAGGGYSEVAGVDDEDDESEDNVQVLDERQAVLTIAHGANEDLEKQHAAPPMILPRPTELPPPAARIGRRRFFGLTVGILAASYGIAFFVSELSTVLGFVGATGSTMICYILPAIFYLKLRESDPWTDKHKLGALFMLIAGCIIMPVCLTANIMKLSRQEGIDEP